MSGTPAGATTADPLPRGPEEEGFSMMELVFAMGVMMVVMFMGLKATGSLLKVEGEAVSKGQSTTQTAAAFNELRQELVSANILFDPANEFDSNNVNYAGTNPDGSRIPPGFSMRVYTQVSGDPMCVQWRLLNTGDLQTRSWSNLWQTNNIVHPWATLASGLDNAQASPPFVLDAGRNYGGSASSRLMDIDLFEVANQARIAPVQMQSSIAARDAEYYPPNTGDCSPVPAP
ncbi:MAG: hypothetical protein ACYDB3_05880 [Acidimicrobiales bacterium]